MSTKYQEKGQRRLKPYLNFGKLPVPFHKFFHNDKHAFQIQNKHNPVMSVITRIKVIREQIPNSLIENIF